MKNSSQSVIEHSETQTNSVQFNNQCHSVGSRIQHQAPPRIGAHLSFEGVTLSRSPCIQDYVASIG